MDPRSVTPERMAELEIPTELFFENEVRQAVRHPRDRGHLEPTNIAGRGVWRLTEHGRVAARGTVLAVMNGNTHEHHLLTTMVRTRLAEEQAADGGEFSGPITPERVLRSIILRRGQPEFRDGLISAYGARCAITADDAVEALEAAPIIPVAQGGVFTPQNGLLLRADVHTLFDLDLWAVDPGERRVRVAPALSKTTYASLDGVVLRNPVDPELQPPELFLRQRWRRFQSAA